jgi:hypothetical protein
VRPLPVVAAAAPPESRPQPQFVDFPSLKKATAVKEEKKSKGPRVSYTSALTGVTPSSLSDTYKFDFSVLPPGSGASPSTATTPAYSRLVTGQAVTPVEVITQSASGGGKKKGKGKVILHFG